MRCEIGGRAAFTGRAGSAIEQAHDAFDDEDLGAGASMRGQGVEQQPWHRPGIEIDARGAGGRGVERRIDVIGAGLCRAHGDAAPRQRRQRRERHRRLAGAGVWRGDDETDAPSLLSLVVAASAPSSCARVVTMSPMTTIAGGSKFCSSTWAATSASVETRMRSFGVVAEAITAAGVLRGEPGCNQTPPRSARDCASPCRARSAARCGRAAPSRKSHRRRGRPRKMTARLVPAQRLPG